MSRARLIVADVHAGLAQVEDGSVDMAVTSPPYPWQRDYLPGDDPAKAFEIGQEPNPEAAITAQLGWIEAVRPKLAPHGLLVVVLADTLCASDRDVISKGRSSKNSAYSRLMQEPRDCLSKGRAANGEHFRNKAASRRRRTPDGWPLDKSVCGIPQAVELGMIYGRNPLTGEPCSQWALRNVGAWCLDGDTVIYARTPKGVGPVRLLHLAQNWQPGQWELWDGARWTPVLGWRSVEADDAIEVEFRNGERISATRSHEWPTGRGLVRTEQLTVGDVVDSVQLPDSDRAEPEGLPAHVGWFVGLFLADGSFDSRDRIQFAGHRRETAVRLERLAVLAAAYDGTCTAHDVGGGNGATVVVRSRVLAAVLRRYLAGAGARNKHLTGAAWQRGNSFLRALLEGYLSGDGHYDAKNDRWRLGFTDNAWLARDLRVLCARIGVVCRLRRRRWSQEDGFAGASSFYYRGDIRLTAAARFSPPGEIVGLRHSRRRRFFDVSVEGEPHLFALGSGLLTHNCKTNPTVGSIMAKLRPGWEHIIVASPDGNDPFFDVDPLRVMPKERDRAGEPVTPYNGHEVPRMTHKQTHPLGRPPLDWMEIPPAQFPGAHYAVFPDALVEPFVVGSPERVCECGRPLYRRLHCDTCGRNGVWRSQKWCLCRREGRRARWTRTTGFVRLCRCPDDMPFRRGMILDPFAGSGTTLAVACGHGRDAVGIELDTRNVPIIHGRVGMFLEDYRPLGPIDVISSL